MLRNQLIGNKYTLVGFFNVVLQYNNSLFIIYLYLLNIIINLYNKFYVIYLLIQEKVKTLNISLYLTNFNIKQYF